jgi:DNA-binding NtrC family response regulator
VPINCAQLGNDVNRIHSELLGHTKGAFTGALQGREGVLAAAHGGTVFLDEVESLSPEAQGFLLSVVEPARPLRPMGASESSPALKVDVRFISASKVPLNKSGLRRDLAERLSELNLILPTLEDRREDIPLLIEKLLAEQRPGERPTRIAAEAITFLAEHNYPGQVRELEAALRMAANEARFRAEDDGLGSAKAVISRDDLERYFEQRNRAHGRGPSPRSSPTALYRVSDLEVVAASAPPPPRKRPGELQRADLEQALRASGGNQTHAAGSLGISLNTLKTKMKALGLRKEEFVQTALPRKADREK